MLNQIVLVGRLTNDVKVEKIENNEKIATITLAVSRSFKNADGVYETDFIDCVLWNGIASNAAEYCKKGDVVGVKGRIQTIKENDKYIPQIIAEKITFLSNKKNEDE